MTIEQLKQWYNLQPEDFWQLRRGGKTITIITHNACEKIAEMVSIVIQEPQWLSRGKNGVWAVQVMGWKRLQPEHKIWTTGESSPDNCKTDYPVAIAEKRAKDRLILKLVNASEYGVLSESEMEELEQTRQETNVSVDELRQRSQELYNTNQIRDLSVQQIQELQLNLGNGN
tara:strand:+ start:193 stop:708 length:516 start_codon:yes stop_codon:yes gene_type:complete